MTATQLAREVLPAVRALLRARRPLVGILWEPILVALLPLVIQAIAAWLKRRRESTGSDSSVVWSEVWDDMDGRDQILLLTQLKTPARTANPDGGHY